MKCTTNQQIEDIPSGTTLMIVTRPDGEKMNVVYKGVVREVLVSSVTMIERAVEEEPQAEKGQRVTREYVIQEIIGDNQEVDYALFITAAQSYLNLRRGEKGWKRKLRKMGYQVVDGKIRKKNPETPQ